VTGDCLVTQSACIAKLAESAPPGKQLESRKGLLQTAKQQPLEWQLLLSVGLQKAGGNTCSGLKLAPHPSQDE
jgi:hypothetical protein